MPDTTVETTLFSFKLLYFLPLFLLVFFRLLSFIIFFLQGLDMVYSSSKEVATLKRKLDQVIVAAKKLWAVTSFCIQLGNQLESTRHYKGRSESALSVYGKEI